MELTAILFYVFSMLTLGSAIFMVVSKNIVHAAFALMFTLLGVAALYVLIFADFLAATQVLVYVGGILILILFGVMLTTQGFTSNLKALTSNLLPVSALMTLVAAGMVFVFYTSTWPVGAMTEPSGTITGLGMLLLHEYMLPFQMTGVLLLVAIIGALLMATRIKHQN
jgi:NADH:ubiquinone oxidoreductase subunit 6 (subunit J)